MTNKIKFLLGFLAIIAGFLITRTGVYVYNNFIKNTSAKYPGNPNPDVNKQSANIETLLNKDSDGDGLPDREEIIYGTNPSKQDTDKDGFIDGEEIISGYDPLNKFDNSRDNAKKPALKNTTTSANFTDRVADLAFASLINDAGDIDLSNASEGSFLDIVQGAKLEMASYFHVPTLADTDIKISSDDSKDSIKKYIEELTPLIEGKVLSANNSIAKSIATYGIITPQDYRGYRTAYNTLILTEVPPSWKELHKKTLTLLLSFSEAFKALSGTTIDSDPVKAVASLNQIQSLSLQIPSLFSEASRLMNKAGIETNNIIINANQN